MPTPEEGRERDATPSTALAHAEPQSSGPPAKRAGNRLAHAPLRCQKADVHGAASVICFSAACLKQEMFAAEGATFPPSQPVPAAGGAASSRHTPRSTKLHCQQH